MQSASMRDMLSQRMMGSGLAHLKLPAPSFGPVPEEGDGEGEEEVGRCGKDRRVWDVLVPGWNVCALYMCCPSSISAKEQRKPIATAPEHKQVAAASF